MPDLTRVLSLGCGVQSTTLLLMSISGHLPHLDAAIFADTGWEPPWVYKQWERLETVGSAAGVAMHRVAKGNIRSDAVGAFVRGTLDKQQRWASLPLYCLAADGSVGMLNRQCTREYKIELIERCIRENVLRVETRGGGGRGILCEQWLGISYDEAGRRSASRVGWKQHRFPLLDDLRSPWATGELFPVGYSRTDCERWLRMHHYPVPLKSACIGCPYRSAAEWASIRAEPVLWEDACAFDDSIRRSGGMRGEVFLHRSCVPLRSANIADPLHWDGVADNECAGICAV